MTKGLGPEASRLIESALLQERIPSHAELARVQRALLCSVTAIAATTGAAAPLAAQTVAAKSIWTGFIVNGSFASAVAVGVTVGGLAIGGSSWVAKQIERPAPLHASSRTAQSIPRLDTPRAQPRDFDTATASTVEPSESNLPDEREASNGQPQARIADAKAAGSPMTPSVLALPSRGVATASAQAREVNTGASSAVPISTKVTPVPADEMASPVPVVAPAASNAALVEPPTPESHQAARSLSDELAHLERAQRAMNRGDSKGALVLLDQLNAGSTGSSLLEERLALEVLAACQTGQRARAERAGSLLRQRNPKSPFLARIRTSCAFELER